MFCTSLEHKLFTIDLLTVEHQLFFSELQGLCEPEDTDDDKQMKKLKKLSCCKNVTNLMWAESQKQARWIFKRCKT